MSKSVDELIDYLLEEIAIGGRQGLTINEIGKRVDTFYNGPNVHSTHHDGDEPLPVTVDGDLLACVWRWLARHPDISIGENKRYNNESLAQIISKFPHYLDSAYALSQEQSRPIDFTSELNEASAPNNNDLDKSPRVSPSHKDTGPRFTVAEERAYRAICGHAPDPAKVAPLEFELLCHIAAARSDGILQGPLGRVSGQDKRSVPKRTDGLYRKGYIVKETVYHHGTKTSRLILTKFADFSTTSLNKTGDSKGASLRESLVRDVVRRVFEELQHQNLLPQSELAESLNMSSSSKSAVLAKIIRRLEQIKLVKRVRMAFGPTAITGDLKLCIQKLRDLDDNALQSFDTNTLSLDQQIRDLALSPEDEDLEPEPGIEVENDHTSSNLSHSSALAWNPDRSMPNILCDAVRRSGENGLTNLNAREQVTGMILRRSVEALMNRISCRSLVQQPPHLRHLAIVRCNLRFDGFAQYLHFSWDAFKALAAEKRIDISQVPGAKKVLKAANSTQSQSHADTELPSQIKVDDFGFPPHEYKFRQLNHGEATFSDLVRQIFQATSRLPRKSRGVVGDPEVRMSSQRNDHVGQAANVQIKASPVVLKDGPTGRPRKYLRGTEKFWKRIFGQAQIDANVKRKNGDAVSAMKDPESLRLFAQRPEGFDELLVRAIDAGLPVPWRFEDINVAWVEATQDILNRSDLTIRISPKGLRPSSTKLASQIMIIGSARLNEVDFYDRNKIHEFRFITSTVSHSFHYRRNYSGSAGFFGRNGRSIISAKKSFGPPKGITKQIDQATAERIDLETGTTSPQSSHANTSSTSPLQSEQALDNAPTDDSKTAQGGFMLSQDHLGSVQRRTTQIPGEIPPPSGEIHAPSRPPPNGLPISGITAASAGQTSEQVPSPSLLTESVLSLQSSTMSTIVGVARDHLSLSDPHNQPSAIPQRQDQATDDVKGSSSTRNDPEHALAPHEPSTPEPTTLQRRPGTATGRRTAKKPAFLRKRARSPSLDSALSQDEFENQTPRKQQKTESGLTGRRQGSLCREIVLDLMALTNGAAPNDGFTIRRTSVPRWQERGGGDGPQLKIVKNAIKSLCTSGKLKQLSFSFRGKDGAMVKRSAIYLPELDPGSDIVQSLRQHIINAEPMDYIAPEWIAEASRAPLLGKETRARSLVSESSPSPRPSRRRRRSRTAESRDLNDNISTASIHDRPEHIRLDSIPSTGFVTLSVPALSSLPVVDLQKWWTDLPTFSEVASIASWAKKNKRRAATRGSGRSVVWTNTADFPSSLEDLFSKFPFVGRLEKPEYDDMNWQRFTREIESVERWEERDIASVQGQRTRYAFINHSVPSALYPGRLEYNKITYHALLQFSGDDQCEEHPFPPTKSLPLFVSALENKDEESHALIALRGSQVEADSGLESDTIGNATTKRKRKVEAKDDHYTPEPKRRKAGTKTTNKRAQDLVTSSPRTLTAKIGRGTQYLRSMSEDQIHRIAISVAVVRTMAGGIEGFIDWPLVLALFPNLPEDVVRGSWKTISKKYSKELIAFVANMQPKYLDALEANEVPSVNFADLKATDWEGIVAWALRTVDRFTARTADELPPSRADLLEAKEMSFPEPKSYSSILAYNVASTGPVKESLAGSMVFASRLRDPVNQVLQHRSNSSIHAIDAATRLAKSWALATVLTPEQDYDPSLTEIKMKKLASTMRDVDGLLHRALKLLQEEKIVQQCPRHSQAESGAKLRGYEVSRNFFERFEERRMITAPMLRRAAWHKFNILDPAFMGNVSVTLDKGAIVHDGEMVAMLNLLAGGCVRPKAGADVPRTRYGLDWERIGYETRKMDKSRLDFSVDIIPTDVYEFGDAHSETRKHPIPRGQADDDSGLIPPWIDIHGTFQPALWEMFVAGVLGSITQLPGSTAKELSRLLGYALDEDEVDLLMSWCVSAGFAKHDVQSSGYETLQGWWLCLSVGVENGWEWNTSIGIRG
ncbi:hypothetical protein B0A52_02018 [Exophiala mesophila]|uniref:Uncharacterized protein n=1 Tax=Exophiala mesophila TaxID=212818 RepID=A0A438NEM5_EXOME|nr:hypothetical protein B0A52_02018 [Exophiala mesophila]